ncbi:MAG: citrate (Si)-synthase, partial [Calditrichaeota bacterium]|nr:citrate (Si)-synthase [Calditrichota bacterium]
VLFAIGRTSGWFAQWQEMLLDKDQKISRPRQVYLGEEQRNLAASEYTDGKAKKKQKMS